MASIGTPAAILPTSGTSVASALLTACARAGIGARLVALDHPRRETGACLTAEAFRQFDDFDGAGAVREAADETAFFQRRDQPVDAGFRPKVESLLHLVKTGWNTVALYTSVNEIQQIQLLLGEHLFGPPTPDLLLFY